jgi:hypothetical protein
MPDNYPHQRLFSTSDQLEQKADDATDSENESTTVSSFAAENFYSVMTQREVKLLTTLFPKAARTLARVLSNRPE